MNTLNIEFVKTSYYPRLTTETVEQLEKLFKKELGEFGENIKIRGNKIYLGIDNASMLRKPDRVIAILKSPEFNYEKYEKKLTNLKNKYLEEKEAKKKAIEFSEVKNKFLIELFEKKMFKIEGLEKEICDWTGEVTIRYMSKLNYRNIIIFNFEENGDFKDLKINFNYTSRSYTIQEALQELTKIKEIQYELKLILQGTNIYKGV